MAQARLVLEAVELSLTLVLAIPLTLFMVDAEHIFGPYALFWRMVLSATFEMNAKCVISWAL